MHSELLISAFAPIDVHLKAQICRRVFTWWSKTDTANEHPS